MQKPLGLEERGRFVLALIYGLLVTLTLILAAGAPYAHW